LRPHKPSGVYVAGGAAEAVLKVTGEPVWIPLASYANKMGYVAASNAATSLSPTGGVNARCVKWW